MRCFWPNTKVITPTRRVRATRPISLWSMRWRELLKSSGRLRRRRSSFRAEYTFKRAAVGLIRFRPASPQRHEAIADRALGPRLIHWASSLAARGLSSRSCRPDIDRSEVQDAQPTRARPERVAYPFRTAGKVERLALPSVLYSTGRGLNGRALASSVRPILPSFGKRGSLVKRVMHYCRP
jgi:hypothetical protein